MTDNLTTISPQPSALSPRRIFTFWEPKDRIPYYLQLCVETWRKFLPSAEITILDYSSLPEYIDLTEYGSGLLDGKFSLPQIADAIRVMLLAEHGGIWLDADTIILSPDACKLLEFRGDNEAVFFGNPENRSVHLAAIQCKPHARCMRLWTEYIRDKVRNFNPPKRDFWAYLGNDFINIYSRTFTDEVGIIPRENALPEILAYPNIPTHSAFLHYYFLDSRRPDTVTQNILLLHNSWTPPAFRNMDGDELLRCDCTMTNILAEVLGLNRSGIGSFRRFRKCSRWSWRRFADRKFSLCV